MSNRFLMRTIPVLVGLFSLIMMVQSLDRSDLLLMEQHVQENGKPLDSDATFYSLKAWWYQQKADRKLAKSGLTKAIGELVEMRDSTYKGYPCTNLYVTLFLQPAKEAAGFKYNWTEPDPDIPKMSQLIFDTAKRASNQCMNDLMWLFARRNRDGFKDYECYQTGMIMDDVSKGLIDNFEQVYGEEWIKSKKLIQLLHELSDSPPEPIPVNEQLYGSSGILTAELLPGKIKKIASAHFPEPCSSYMSHYKKIFNPMVEFVYLLDNLNESTNRKFLKRLESYELCKYYSELL